ncbi:hypothetical protein MGSAQ_002580 [marine sediment metagenome]|uniref:Uncharacterized protein n=1 Tax=marine sediment metagenome TaxID=412755 RepID=A0A1B6NR45_9ZZZZ
MEIRSWKSSGVRICATSSAKMVTPRRAIASYRGWRWARARA